MIVIKQIPFYWGIEHDAEERSLVSRSWLVEDLIPFRESVWAFRIRVSHNHWLHFGKFRYRREALHAGLVFRPTQIGRWGVQEEDTFEGVVSVRPVEHDRATGSDRVFNGDDGATVPGDVTPRD